MIDYDKDHSGKGNQIRNQFHPHFQPPVNYNPGIATLEVIVDLFFRLCHSFIHFAKGSDDC
jgi:hypothetical protein